jgi:hypothetical protein
VISRVVATVVAVVVLFLGAAFYLQRRDKRIADEALAKAKSEQLTKKEEILVDTLKQDDIIVRDATSDYRRTADREIRSNPASAPVRRVKESADRAISAHEKKDSTQSELISTQKEHIETLKKLGLAKEPRLEGRFAAGYDAFQQAALARASGRVRIYKSFSIVAELEARQRRDFTSSDSSRVQFGANILGELRFR